MADILLPVTPGQVLYPDRKVLVPGVAKEFVFVPLGDGGLAELTSTLTGALEHYRAVVMFFDPPNGSEDLIKGFVKDV